MVCCCECKKISIPWLVFSIILVIGGIIGLIYTMRTSIFWLNAIYTSKKGVDDGHSPSEINTFIINTLYWISTTGVDNITEYINKKKIGVDIDWKIGNNFLIENIINTLLIYFVYLLLIILIILLTILTNIVIILLTKYILNMNNL